MPLLTRRRFLTVLAGGTSLAGGGFIYARFVEPGWLRTQHIEVPIPAERLEGPLRLAHLADLHLSKVVPFSLIARAIDLAISAQPDVICITGDFITRSLSSPDEYALLLRRLTETAPTFAVMGNHDGGKWAHPRGGYADTGRVGTMLEAAGIRLLDNARRTARIAGQVIQLVGVADLWAGTADPDTAFANIDPSAGAILLLSHNPDSKALLHGFPWDIMLSGHTHGGQLKVPGLGTPFAPVEDHRYVHGLKLWEDRWIHVTSGVGNVGGMRINCRPEVSILSLRPE